MEKPVADGANLYGGYAEWKQWDGDFSTSDRDARCFAAEFGGIPLAGKRLLEIGFGNGGFLAWAKAQGAIVAGTEIDETMLARAREKGFAVLPPALDALAAGGARFDVIVAFDVFEHWEKPTLIANLKYIAAALERHGLLLARFPNGHSPFGRVHQHGDITHCTALSRSSIGQLARLTGFDVVRVDNAQRVPARRDPWSLLKHRWRRLRCDHIERRIAKLYGTGRLPLDPNLTAVLRKSD
ncbi:MAG: class I SAM-dependent methyltransferase [Rudaea sp.]|nr:class I SAM-dependent methyltransferase [Rudaea sp.]